MPRQPNPPRLWKRPERRDKSGKLTHTSTWIILDGGRQISTGLDASDVIGAQKALADYINRRHTESITKGPRSAENIPIVDVLNLYCRDVVPKHANPQAAVRVFKRLETFFGDKHLSQINGQLCREYAATRPAIQPAAIWKSFALRSITIIAKVCTIASSRFGCRRKHGRASDG